MQAEAFWVKGNEIIEVHEDSHINVIRQHPEKFGLSAGTVKALYAKCGEKIGTEGSAREDIIRLAADTGWIRIRHYLTPQDYWSVQFDSWDKRKKDVVTFIKWAVSKKIISATDELRLTGYRDGFYKDFSFSEGGIGLFLNGLE